MLCQARKMKLQYETRTEFRIIDLVKKLPLCTGKFSKHDQASDRNYFTAYKMINMYILKDI